MLSIPAPVIQHRFADAFPELSVPHTPESAPEPELIALNAPLASELGFDPSWLRSEDGIAFLLGSDAPHAVAQAYSGHQFGHYSPLLGDGRACLLGEVRACTGTLYDLHLKGSGPTRFARAGDGRAALGPMLREFMISNFLHTVGVPTTRSLAVISTGHRVQRERSLPAAILVRVATSHLRIGTFQVVSSVDLLRRLADYASQLHYPDTEGDALALLEAVMDSQSDTVARWMGLGFIHGVMNTDNTTISGETIDFGPCAFLEHHDPHAWFSSIDTKGRYRFGNQPGILAWNLQRFAETLLPLIDATPSEAIRKAELLCDSFADRFMGAYRSVLQEKLDGAIPSNFHIHGDHTAYFSDIAPLKNPVIIPRNHLVEAAIQQANDGNTEPFCALYASLTTPYDIPSQHPEFMQAAPPGFTEQFRTYCGT